MSIAQIIALLSQILPPLLQGAETIAQNRGLPVDHPDVAKAIVDHNTPGAPSAPELQ